MTIHNTSVLADNLQQAYYGNNWTDVCLADTLNGIGYRQAIQRTEASANTIAALVNHLWFWNTVILQRMRGENPSIPDQNGMDVGDLHNEEEWQALIKKMRASFDELIGAIREFPAEGLDKFVKGRNTTIGFHLNGISEHAYYHLGQIVLLKKLTS